MNFYYSSLHIVTFRVFKKWLVSFDLGGAWGAFPTLLLLEMDVHESFTFSEFLHKTYRLVPSSKNDPNSSPSIGHYATLALYTNP